MIVIVGHKAFAEPDDQFSMQRAITKSPIELLGFLCCSVRQRLKRPLWDPVCHAHMHHFADCGTKWGIRPCPLPRRERAAFEAWVGFLTASISPSCWSLLSGGGDIDALL